jgi:hypothetical protein
LYILFFVTSKTTAPPPVPPWTFLSNHAHVLICIAQQPDIRLSEIAQRVGIGERAAHRIVHDLIDAAFLTQRRVGRRNVYTVDLDRPLRHPLESDHFIRAIVDPLLGDAAPTSPVGDDS